MSEYICREAALEAVCKYCCEYDSESTECICNERLAVLKIPIADVAPVRHGRWVKRGCKWQCTNCKVLMSIDGTPKENLLNYCNNCGAKMDGGADNG